MSPSKPNLSPDPVAAFEVERAACAATYPGEVEWQEVSAKWMRLAFEKRYMYNFSVLGRPIIQTPIDAMAFQEIVWEVRPDLIIETGIAHGGSLILSAAALALIDYCDAVASGESLDPRKPKRRVLGIDIDIRAHNRAAIEAHPMAHRIDLLQGSSLANETINTVRKHAARAEKVLVCLDSNHTHDHVLKELELYAPLVSPGSYCLVFDTIVEDLPANAFPDRPWKPGNNPKTAVREYLRQLGAQKFYDAKGQALNFEIDKSIENKLMLTVAPEGYLKRV
jgi:cephalosporin hydroxylase